MHSLLLRYGRKFFLFLKEKITATCLKCEWKLPSWFCNVSLYWKIKGFTRQGQQIEGNPTVAVCSRFVSCSLEFCAGFEWSRVHFVYSIGTGLWFGSVLNTVSITQGWFCHCWAELRPFLLLTLLLQQGDWGCTSVWEGTWLGKLTTADKRDISFHIYFIHAQQIKMGEEGGREFWGGSSE